MFSEDTYILRSNIHDWTEEEVWKTYITHVSAMLGQDLIIVHRGKVVLCHKPNDPF